MKSGFAVLCALLAACACMAACHTVSTASYAADKGDSVPNTVKFHVERELVRETSDKNGTTKDWLNFLIIDGINDKIPLIPSSEMQNKDGHYSPSLGLDDDSLKVTWLDKGHLLLASWDDLGCGGSLGLYVHSYVILQIVNGVPRELFRDNFLSGVNNGWRGGKSTKVDVRYSAADGKVLITMNRRLEEVGEEKLPLCNDETVETSGSNEKCYERKLDIIDEYEYKLSGTYLVFGGGTRSLELGNRRCKISDVAACLQVTEGDIRKLNNLPPSAKTCSGLIKFNDAFGPIDTATYESASYIGEIDDLK